MPARFHFATLVLLCCLSALAPAATKDKPGKEAGGKAGRAALTPEESEIAEALKDAGVAPAAAEKLARKMANDADPGYKDALKTAWLINTISSDLLSLEVPADMISKVVTEIADRGLTDRTPGGAGRTLAGISAIDAIAGTGASRILPQGAERNADAIARALAAAIADLHTAGLTDKDPDYNKVVGGILKRGLYGSEARDLVRSVTDPLVKAAEAASDDGNPPPAKPPKSTPPDSRPSGDTSEPPEPKVIPRPASGGGSTGTGSSQGGGGGGGSQPSTPAPQPTAEGKKRSSGRMTFEDEPAQNSGEDSHTHQSEFDRAAEKKAAEEKAAKEKADEDKKDDEKKDEGTPPATSGSEEATGTSVDRDGDQAYHGKPTLGGILDRLERLGARPGQQTNPSPSGEGPVDRSQPIVNPKAGLIGNPGSSAVRPAPVIDRSKVQPPGPKPGQVNPDPTSPTNPPPGKK